MRKENTISITKSHIVQKHSTNEALWNGIALALVAPVAYMWHFNIMTIIDIIKYL